MQPLSNIVCVCRVDVVVADCLLISSSPSLPSLSLTLSGKSQAELNLCAVKIENATGNIRSTISPVVYEKNKQ